MTDRIYRRFYRRMVFLLKNDSTPDIKQMLIDKVKTQITEAMKVGDRVRLETLKMLSAALTNAEIAKKREKLTEEEELKVVQSEAKKRKDAIESYQKSQNSKNPNIQERIRKEKSELVILQEFLPQEMEESELVKLVDQAVKATNASGMQDFGKIMGFVMGKVKGKASGDRVSAIVKGKLS